MLLWDSTVAAREAMTVLKAGTLRRLEAGVGKRGATAVTGVESPSLISGATIGDGGKSQGERRAAINLTPNTFRRGTSSRAMLPNPMINTVEP